MVAWPCASADVPPYQVLRNVCMSALCMLPQQCYLSRWQPGQKELEVEDWDTGTDLTIPLASG